MGAIQSGLAGAQPATASNVALIAGLTSAGVVLLVGVLAVGGMFNRKKRAAMLQRLKGRRAASPEAGPEASTGTRAPGTNQGSSSKGVEMPPPPALPRRLSSTAPSELTDQHPV